MIKIWGFTEIKEFREVLLTDDGSNLVSTTAKPFQLPEVPTNTLIAKIKTGDRISFDVVYFQPVYLRTSGRKEVKHEIWLRRK